MPSAAEHSLQVRVYYEDTDAAGIVYYANYLKFAERARTEFLRRAGIEQRALQDENGVLFAVRRCEIDYLRPARLDDVLEVRSRIVASRGASLTMWQAIMLGAEILAQLSVRVACVDRAGRPARIPPQVQRVIRAFAADDAPNGTRGGAPDGATGMDED